MKGVPLEHHSDQGRSFESELWRQVITLLGEQLLLTLCLMKWLRGPIKSSTTRYFLFCFQEPKWLSYSCHKGVPNINLLVTLQQCYLLWGQCNSLLTWSAKLDGNDFVILKYVKDLKNITKNPWFCSKQLHITSELNWDLTRMHHQLIWRRAMQYDSFNPIEVTD